MEGINLDEILSDIGGFGRYQVKRYILLCLILIYATFPTLSYIFTTRNLNYRCYIDECDFDAGYKYHTEWLQNAVPYKDMLPSTCTRYAYSNGNDTTNCTTSFNKNVIGKCNRFVYENDADRTIGRDFHISCDDNLWKLTIVGAINNVGFITGLPLSGYISDRFGRRTLMIGSVLSSTVLGVLKSFSISYICFIVLEFMDMALGAGAYSATYILGMELLVAEKRVLGSTLMSCAFALGEAVMGLVAWYTPVWRNFLRIIYGPGIIFISYFWLTDESVRWLLLKDKNSKAKKILKKIATENNARLKTSVVKQLNIIKENCTVKQDSFMNVFQSPTLFLRLVNCSFAWICCTFVYYGLTMHSVGISGNIYINYISVALIEIPAYIVAYFILDKLGRKYSLSLSFLLSGVACIGFVFTPEDNTYIKLFLFLFGKFAVTISYATIYLYTTEMFPTSLRHSFMSTCSMFGRLGSMIAPQIPLLARVSKSLPLLLFGAMATTAGILSILFPETLNIKLPDTIEEAVLIGRIRNGSIEDASKVKRKDENGL